MNSQAMQNNANHPPILEITILSAQDLMKQTCLAFSGRLRPFITVSAAARIYTTRVDERGGANPAWGDKFEICLDRAFFYQRYPGIYLQLHTKHFLLGRSQLGWCVVPASDLVSRLAPVGSTRFLSYRLRDKDGSRGHGVVNVAVRLQGGAVYHSQPLVSDDQLVVGFPLEPWRC